MKKISLLLALLMIISVFNPNVLAYEGEKREKEVIKVGEISVVSPYRLKEVEVKHYEDNNFYYADVYSLKDNKLLVTYKEEKPQEITVMECGKETVKDLFVTFYDDPVEVTVRAECKIYVECTSVGVLRHITIISADHYISSSGYFELNNKKTTIYNENIQCSGTMEIEVNEENGVEFSVEVLEKLGFKVYRKEGKIYHLRRAYNKTVDINRGL